MSLFQLTVFLFVHMGVTDSYAMRHFLPSLIFFKYSLQAFHCIEMFTPAATFPQSAPFPSLNCRHFPTTRPAVTCLNKNSQQVNTRRNLDFDLDDLGDHTL